MKKREFRNLCQGGRTVGQYVDDFSKLACYAPDDVAADAAKKEKFLEGLNDELSMQLMVENSITTRSWWIEHSCLKGSSSRLTAARGSMDKGSIILELSRDPVSPRTREDLFITMEATLIMEEVRTIIVAPRTVMVMEEVADRTVPTRQHPPRRI